MILFTNKERESEDLKLIYSKLVSNLTKDVEVIQVVYHYPCSDGVAAMLATASWFDNTEDIQGKVDMRFIQANYNKPLSEPLDKGEKSIVIIVDFSIPPEELIKIDAKLVIVLDHHKSAVDSYKETKIHFPDNKFLILFSADNSASSAGLAYRLFRDSYPDDVVKTAHSSLIHDIESRDLWKLDESKTIPHTHMFMNSLVSELKNDPRPNERIFSDFEEGMFDNLSHEYIIEQYETAVTYHNNSVATIAKGAIVRILDKLELYDNSKSLTQILNPLRNLEYAIVNCPGQFSSDVGSVLNTELGVDIAILWYLDNSGKAKVSLRSRPGHGKDLGLLKFAKFYGGGGHEDACGFVTTFDNLSSLYLKNFI